eukprot:3933187-Rhodomonas_salina.1
MFGDSKLQQNHAIGSEQVDSPGIMMGMAVASNAELANYIAIHARNSFFGSNLAATQSGLAAELEFIAAFFEWSFFISSLQHLPHYKRASSKPFSTVGAMKRISLLGNGGSRFSRTMPRGSARGRLGACRRKGSCTGASWLLHARACFRRPSRGSAC